MGESGRREQGDPQAAPKGGFELPLPEEERSPRLRRRPFGVRPGDVREELRRRDDVIAQLQRDVSALWLAFGQHERTIRELLSTLERLSGIEIAAPQPREGSEAPGPASEPGRAPAEQAPDADRIGEQLANLDEVLAAIGRATSSLEQAYEAEIEASRKARGAEAERTAGDDTLDEAPRGDEGHGAEAGRAERDR